jgi:hypothetical protein
LSRYQEIYIHEHDCEVACAKYTKDGKHDCARCVKEFKEPQGKVAIPCPTYPLYSDSVTKVLSYEDLFAVNTSEKSERDEKARAVRLEKEYEARQAAKSKGKVTLTKENKSEEQKLDEKLEQVEENRNADDIGKQNQVGDKFTEEIGTDGNNLEESAGESSIEEQKLEMISSNTSKFGESLFARREYEESWEHYINGD